MAAMGTHHVNPRILVIDDDQACCRLVAAIFRTEGFDVFSAHDGPLGFSTALTERPDLVMLDLRMPSLDGMAILERLKQEAPSIPVVMLTGSMDVKDAVRAMQLGAFHYLTKPINRAEVVIVVRRALEARAMRLELDELRRHAGAPGADSLASLMGRGEAISRVIQQVALVAASKFSVLILGETGTGKELVSQAIHRMSDRRRGPFIPLDCGAIPDALLESELFGHEKGAFTGADRRKEGRFRLAEGGTCFLDEISNLPLILQAKLLRVLESGEVQAVGADKATPMDVRFVAATNHDLQERVASGAFRSDLFFRLAQYAIRLPPLRDRTEDIPFLTTRFIDEAAQELRHPIETITPDALEVLVAHPWPGNVRELRNVVRQAVLHAPGLVVKAETVRAVIGEPWRDPQRPAPRPGESLRETAERAAAAAERDAICTALRAAGGNKAAAARALRTDYKTLHVKMKDMRIQARDFHHPAPAAEGETPRQERKG
jgi:DNA-binding NtrC family response regulator